MARPTNKTELLMLSNSSYIQLNEFIDQLNEKQKKQEFPKGTMNRNIRDVLAHLHHWHIMFLEWYNTGIKGLKPDMPAKGFTWKETPLLNKTIWQKYQTIELKKVRGLLQKSFSEIQELIERHSNEELFEKKKYRWTGSTSLGAYLVSATSSHYDWALKRIVINNNIRYKKNI